MIPPMRDTTDGLAALQRRLDASRAYAAGKPLTDKELADAQHFTDTVALGFVKGMELLLADPTVMEQFGKQVYNAIIKQGKADTGNWMFERLWLFALAAAGLWLIMRGKST